MIQRFLYRSFWNFYDNLGIFLLLGAVSSITVLTIAVTAAHAISRLDPAILQIGGYVIAAFIILLLLGIAFAATFAISELGAREIPGRLHHAGQGIKAFTLPYCKLIAVAIVVALVTISNVWFYLSVSAGSSSWLLAGTVASAIFFWLYLALMSYFAVYAAAICRFYPEIKSFRSVGAKAFIYLSITPGLWAFCLFWIVLWLVPCILSRIGVVFLLPLIAVFCSTALHLTIQYADHLMQAREQLGSNQPLKNYRDRALQLGRDWELKQPRRTLRELLKPWDH